MLHWLAMAFVMMRPTMLTATMMVEIAVPIMTFLLMVSVMTKLTLLDATMMEETVV